MVALVVLKGLHALRVQKVFGLVDSKNSGFVLQYKSIKVFDAFSVGQKLNYGGSLPVGCCIYSGVYGVFCVCCWVFARIVYV